MIPHNPFWDNPFSLPSGDTEPKKEETKRKTPTHEMITDCLIAVFIVLPLILMIPACVVTLFKILKK